MTIEFVKKITARDIGARVQLTLADGEKVEAYRVAGWANGYKVAKSTYGDSFGLLGEFHAMLPTGEIVASAVCFLPSEVTNPMVAELDRQRAENEGVDGFVPRVEFAVAIYATGIKPRDNGGSPFKWSFVPLMEQQTESAASRLLKASLAVPVKVKSLGAPVPEQPAAHAAEPSTEPEKAPKAGK